MLPDVLKTTDAALNKAANAAEDANKLNQIPH
jgi:hypothetical protein